jgi:hypothetical protein
VSSFRRSAELKAGPLVVLLARAPRWLPFAVVLGCVVGGLVLHGPIAAVLLAVVLVLLGLQLFFAWPVLEPPQRLLRLLVLLLLVGAVGSRF